MNADAGVYNVTITANDGHADTANGVITFNVTINANPPPAVNETLVDLTFVEDRANSGFITIYPFLEPNSEVITVADSFSPTAPFLTYNNVTGEISGSPVYANIGTYTLSLVATDSWPDTGSTTQTVSV